MKDLDKHDMKKMFYAENENNKNIISQNNYSVEKM